MDNKITIYNNKLKLASLTTSVWKKKKTLLMVYTMARFENDV